MDDNELQFFDPTSENITFFKKLLTKQGVNVCQDQVNSRWINESLSRFSFGYAFISRKAQIGRRSLKNEEDKFILKGFVIGRINIAQPQTVTIDLVCSRQETKLGKVLMELSEEKAKSIPAVKLIQLFSLPEKKLKKWYNSLGFGEIEERSFEDGTLKAYLMQKFI